MDEITFDDMLFHYEAKLKEASEEIQNIKRQIKQIIAALDSGWSGKAAAACREKLEYIAGELAKSDGEISEALIKLSAVGELLADSEESV